MKISQTIYIQVSKPKITKNSKTLPPLSLYHLTLSSLSNLTTLDQRQPHLPSTNFSTILHHTSNHHHCLAPLWPPTEHLPPNKHSRVCVHDVEDLRKLIIEEAYCLAYTIHSGSTKMYQTVNENYWWSGMKKNITDFVSRCLVCQQVKAKHQKPPRTLLS